MKLFSKRVLSETELHYLKEYSFNPGNFTFVDDLMLKYFYTPLVRMLPMWLNANLITLTGGFAILLMNVLVFHFVPNFKASSVPKWTSLVSAVLFFVYTTFDGIDGMQARRLKLASPLGQLLDHGTDALVSSFICYFTFLIRPTGFTLLNAMITVSALINTAAVNWREESFGTFSYTNSFFIFGVSEPLLAVTMVLASDYFYPKFWNSPMVKVLSKCPSLNFLVKYLPRRTTWFTVFLYAALILSYYTFFGFPYEMYKNHRSPKRLFRLTLYLMFNCVFPPLLTVYLPQKLHGLYSLFVSSLGGFGVVFIIITNMRRRKRLLLYPEFYLHYLLVFFGYALVFLRRFYGLNYDKKVFNSDCFRNLLLFLCIYGVLSGLSKAVRTVYEIKTYLGLPFFTTKKTRKRS